MQRLYYREKDERTEEPDHDAIFWSFLHNNFIWKGNAIPGFVDLGSTRLHTSI